MLCVIIKCALDGLPRGRNCSDVWSFWCSVLCSINQMATVQRRGVMDVRGPEWFCQPFLITLDKYSSWIERKVVSMIRSAVQTDLCSLLRSDLEAELNQCRGWIQWWQSRTVSAALVVVNNTNQVRKFVSLFKIACQAGQYNLEVLLDKTIAGTSG